MAKPATAAPEITVRQVPTVIEYLDPQQIIVRNNRKPVLDQEFTDSIRETGVLQPIGVLRTSDQEWILRFGGRRLQACIELGRQVPAIVIDVDADSDRAEIERIFQQLDENDKRLPLTAADRATAVETLFSLGADAKTVTRRTGLGKDELAAARKVAASETARTLAAQYPLNLEQTVAIAEFEGDDQAVSGLVEAAKEGTGSFAHALQEARDDRADREAIAAHAAKLAKQGITVSDTALHYENSLIYWADNDGKPLTPETHKACPGNVVVLRAYFDHEVRETWYCTDPKGNGHKRQRSSNGTDQSPEDRKQVIEGNKAWRSAEKVRRRFLRELLSRHEFPADTRHRALAFVLEAFARSDGRLRVAMEHRADGTHIMARELLGLPVAAGSGWSRPPEVYTAMTTASPARAQVIALALVFGAYEASTGVHSWRNPSPETAGYLETLTRWGYGLSEIEARLVADARQTEAKIAAANKTDEAAAAEHDDAVDETAGED